MGGLGRKTTLGLVLLPALCHADGRGLIGYGRNMYYPLCAAVCRGSIEQAPLVCTPHDIKDGAHSHGGTPYECHASDPAYLTTLAYCINQRCGDNYTADIIESYWRQHAVNGGRIVLEPKPVMSYSQALDSIKTPPTEEYVSGEMLNVTSLVSDEDFISYEHAFGLFEQVESGHSKYSLLVMISGFLVPLGFSTLRFLPFPPLLRSKIKAVLDHPAMIGSRHRAPVAFGQGIMPTRGQALFIAYFIFINAVVCMVDIKAGPQPNAWYADDWQQIMSYVGDRAGAMSFANLSLMFLYSSRNNFLLWLTDWSHSTFLLLHRWVGYIAVIQACLHSAVLLHVYIVIEAYESSVVEAWWYWGVIATCGMVIIWGLSILPVRQRVYEFFLLSHIALTILVLVGCYLHVFYLYENNWGYEIYIYVAGAVWGADRVIRIWRVLRNGVRRATISQIDEDYVRVDIDGVSAHGHVYLYFPTLSLKFWENHPFSVTSSFAGRPTSPITPVTTTVTVEDGEKSEKVESPSPPAYHPRPSLTILARVRTGVTAALAKRVVTGASLPVLVESSYHSAPQQAELDKCTTLVCIAGGVGISTVLPLMQRHPGPRARLYWGMRRASLKDAVAGELQGLNVVYSVGERLDLREIIVAELARKDESGDVGIVVSGPEGMADDVRAIVCEVSKGVARRGVVFVDEAFSW
ncbi:hypothetical protein OQA88_12508 [Cercophora sp. LCS_1]